MNDLGIDVRQTKRTITAARGARGVHSRHVGVAKSISISFDGATPKIKFVALGGIPLDIIVWMTDLELF